MKNDCLELLREVREAASIPDQAYVLRSRLGRLLVNCLRTAAHRAGATEPDYPQWFELPDGSPVTAVEIVTECNQILDASSSLVQPSEPLDSRWRDGWRRIERKLDSLELKLREHDLDGR